jgi:ABC-type branched-subunit amino acid transport system substrate-binding protein
VLYDYGVTEDTIRIGLNADLSGAFAALVTQIVDGQEAFWDIVNENGGVAGRQIELVVLDNAYDVPTHLANYEEFAQESEDGILMFSQSTGSPHTAATAEMLVDDNLLAIPLSWYSGWADPGVAGANVMELYTSYCIESMNGVEYMAKELGAETIGIISFPGEYGQDGATGAKMAAEALGLEIVFDGEGQIIPGSDQTPLITGLVEANPDIIWTTSNPATTAEIMGGVYAQGLTAQWSGNSPSWNYQLLATDLGPVADAVYWHSTYTQLWETDDTPGMTAMVEGMRRLKPDAPLSDVYIISWTEGMATLAVLEQAAANGDMTREGIVKAFGEVSVDFQGLAPDQTWAGEPNDYIVRESFIYDVVADNFDAGATVSDEGAGTGFELLAANYVGDVATAYSFDGACFSAG